MLLPNIPSRADSSLFIYKTTSVTCYFLVYVDDLVITRNDPIFVSSIIVQLSNRFSLKDMGQLHFFSGHGGYSHYHKSLFVSAQIHQRLINKDEHAWSKKGYHSTIHNYCAQVIDGTSSVDCTEYKCYWCHAILISHTS